MMTLTLTPTPFSTIVLTVGIFLGCDPIAEVAAAVQLSKVRRCFLLSFYYSKLSGVLVEK